MNYKFRSWQSAKWNPAVHRGANESDIPVAILSLVDQSERRRLLQERGVPEEWVREYFPAIDLRSATFEELNEILTSTGYDYNPGWPSSVLGCAVTHGKAAEWQLAARWPLMLVLEDDAVPASSDYCQQLASIAELLMPSALSGAAFTCHLGVRPEQLVNTLTRSVITTRQRCKVVSMRLQSDPRPTIWRAHAYLISLGAARQSARRDKQLLAVADDWTARASLKFYDRLYIATPRLFQQDEDAASTLDHTQDALTLQHSANEQGLTQRALSSLLFRSRMLKANILRFIPVSL